MNSILKHSHSFKNIFKPNLYKNAINIQLNYNFSKNSRTPVKETQE